MGDLVLSDQAVRLCKVCGEPIRRGSAQFCSQVCRRIWSKRPQWRVCRLCGQQFWSEDGARRCAPCRKLLSTAGGGGKIRQDAPFADFLLAQRRARAEGRELRYADWQKERYK